MFLHLPFVFIHLYYFLQKLVHLLNDFGRIENFHLFAEATYPTKKRGSCLYADRYRKMGFIGGYQHHIFAEAVNDRVGNFVDTA